MVECDKSTLLNKYAIPETRADRFVVREFEFVSVAFQVGACVACAPTVRYTRVNEMHCIRVYEQPRKWSESILIRIAVGDVKLDIAHIRRGISARLCVDNLNSKCAIVDLHVCQVTINSKCMAYQLPNDFWPGHFANSIEINLFALPADMQISRMHAVHRAHTHTLAAVILLPKIKRKRIKLKFYQKCISFGASVICKLPFNCNIVSCRVIPIPFRSRDCNFFLLLLIAARWCCISFMPFICMVAYCERGYSPSDQFRSGHSKHAHTHTREKGERKKAHKKLVNYLFSA